MYNIFSVSEWKGREWDRETERTRIEREREGGWGFRLCSPIIFRSHSLSSLPLPLQKKNKVPESTIIKGACVAADVEWWQRSLRSAVGYFDKEQWRKKSIKSGLCQSLSRALENAKLLSTTPRQTQNEQPIDWHCLWHKPFISLAAEYGGLHSWWSLSGRTTPEEKTCSRGQRVWWHWTMWQWLTALTSVICRF